MTLTIVVTQRARAAFEVAASSVAGVDIDWITYEHEDEIQDKVSRHLAAGRVDGVVLGLMPYDRCRDVLPDAVTVGIVRVSAADLAVAFARIAAQGRPLYPASIDTFDLDVVQEVARALRVPLDQVVCMPHSPEDSVDALVAFHREFNRRHPGALAVTGRSEVRRRLREETDLTVVDEAPLLSHVRSVLRETALRVQSRQAGDQSFGAALVRVLSHGDAGRAGGEVRRLLLNRAEFADAWVEDRGDRGVAVFAHRALLEVATHRWEAVPFVGAAREELGLTVAAGFGLGPSARLCVRFAEQAVARAEEQGGGCGFLVGDRGLVVGPIGAGSTLAFTYREHSPDLEALAQDTGLSATTLSRVAAADRKLGGRPISPAELAAVLGLTEPSARRLLRTLASHSVAVEAGTAQSSRRGRPTHLYRLMLASGGAKAGVPAGPLTGA
jgi:hypothetical protein